LDMSEAVTSIVEMINTDGHLHMVCTANLDHLATIQKDSEFRDVYKNADLILADGMPIVWLSHLGSAPLKERVAGSDLLYALAKESSKSGLRLFFLGGKPSAAEKSARILQKMYPGAQVSGYYCPAPDVLDTLEEDLRICHMIEEAKTDVVLVGFGAPKQEIWINKHRLALKASVAIGVGGAFDMASGIVKRAPSWMQHCGMEWSYRLIQEPKRLWKRYLGCDLPFLGRLLLEALRQRRKIHSQRAAAKSNTL